MLGVIDVSMVDMPESKLDVALKAIEALSIKTNHIEDFVIRFYNDQKAGTFQPMPSVALQVFHLENQQYF